MTKGHLCIDCNKQSVCIHFQKLHDIMESDAVTEETVFPYSVDDYDEDQFVQAGVWECPFYEVKTNA